MLYIFKTKFFTGITALYTNEQLGKIQIPQKSTQSSPRLAELFELVDPFHICSNSVTFTTDEAFIGKEKLDAVIISSAVVLAKSSSAC
jgi:hypothetical protein